MAGWQIDDEGLAALEQRYRAQLINSLSGFKSANLIGTSGSDGITNLAMVSSVVHLGADPPLMGDITRPRSVERHSVDNIEAYGVFTISQVGAGFYQQAHQTSARYPRAVSEFSATGLTPEWWPGSTAPAVAESALAIWLRLEQLLPIAANDTQLVIGRIERLRLRGCSPQADGYLDIEAIGAVAVSGLGSYHATSRLARLPYAKP
ncbi:MAG: flavin reductase [Gammaproteobacteria bacterium]|nr:flavin reductase [Gammaproteobacteria bacterium]